MRSSSINKYLIWNFIYTFFLIHTGYKDMRMCTLCYKVVYGTEITFCENILFSTPGIKFRNHLQITPSNINLICNIVYIGKLYSISKETLENIISVSFFLTNLNKSEFIILIILLPSSKNDLHSQQQKAFKLSCNK